MLFDDEELKSIIRYIDLYHEAVSEATRSRAIEFLTSKLQEKVPGMTKEKTIEIIKDFHLDLFRDSDDNDGTSSSSLSYHSPKKPYEIPDISKSDRLDSRRFNSSLLTDDDLLMKKILNQRKGLLTERYQSTRQSDKYDGFLSDRYYPRGLGYKPSFENRYRTPQPVRPPVLENRYRTPLPSRPPSIVPPLELWKIERDREMDEFTNRSKILAKDIDNHSNNTTNALERIEKQLDDLHKLRSAKHNSKEEDTEYLERLIDIFDSDVTKTKDSEKEKSKEKPKRTVPFITPTWMERQEKLYYENLSDEMKIEIIDSYEEMKSLESNASEPIRLRVLLSNIPEKKKSEIFSRLESSLPGLGESQKYLSWVNSLLSIPFGVQTPMPCSSESVDGICNYMNECKDIFDTEVYGHDKIKNEFLTLLGSWLTAGGSHEHGNVIGITGPIGVGKTTLIKEGLAKALKRPFYFISLGGTSYSSFLQGHGYTYEGSTYGEIARGVIESGCMDPVFYFDELDKVASDGKGEEIIHALIHLTDPAQNNQYHDRYFAGINLDVSKALFVFSYNNKEKVNPILRDRIHEIVLNDFTVEEKIDIASKYVLPKICRGMSLDIEKLITFSEGSLKHLVELCEETTGMRTLKTVLIRLLRILNLASISENQLVLNVDKKLVKGNAPYTVTRELLEDIYNFSESEEKSTPGVSNLMMYM